MDNFQVQWVVLLCYLTVSKSKQTSTKYMNNIISHRLYLTRCKTCRKGIFKIMWDLHRNYNDLEISFNAERNSFYS